MNYQSTRNAALTASSAEAILNGLAPDGGLYAMPALSGLDFDWQRCLTLSTQGMATEILCALLPDFTHAEMEQLVHAAYTGKFETEDLTPTVPVGEDTVLELFRGPTSAFKDVALSMLPHLMTAAKKKCGVDDEILILTATSGDTGKAAMEGFCDVAGTKIIVFYPDGGVSAMYGRDVNGPTALLHSVSRLPFEKASNGTLLNMKFLPQFFKTQTGIVKFTQLLRAVCRLGISHIQFNVLNEADLKDAQAHPENYRGLTVRVAGYTAYFTELARDLQDEIIARTTYEAI